ncbi:CubicO group peptidase (beta-lactamase class C family) [Saccharothrix saharensis]|uniref:CubicO group peptidase (Beta-lactamase class C family) n=1 Tax=Saccharothrix saharensis TaxID=571190 RepID=A0A543JM70_9PSEU|nr:serine hydrolase domain-containing protein [Saccharothrix saharensis]TQM83952.1 CubicO group peptidase (beta-lactamase class C family) [Saccharothrix saharensis]
MTVEGTCADEFAEVRTEFERNFAERGEVGAGVHVTVDGVTVVDLWGGDAGGRPWREDTITHVWSCTKGATALCAHVLASRGELDLDAPVVEYWPEFGRDGKVGTLVRHLLAHQAGLTAVREPVPAGGMLDWDLMTGLLARQEPFWEPGTRHGYHALTFGHLVGEVVRRVSGTGLAEFFEKEVSGPLGLDFWLTLPEDLEPLVARTIPADRGEAVPAVYVAAMGSPGSMQSLLMGNSGGYVAASDTREAHAAQYGSVGGMSNARGLAQLYRPLALGGEYNGVRLVDEAQIPLMSGVVSAGHDEMLLAPTRFSLGFMKAAANRHLPAVERGVAMADGAFGHSGMGGSLGFADPGARMSFGYAMTKMGPGLGVNARGQSLVDAVYRALGHRQASDGAWFR